MKIKNINILLVNNILNLISAFLVLIFRLASLLFHFFYCLYS